MAIIGEKLESYVINQINARQSLHGSGAGTANDGSQDIRSDQQINLLNSNTSWVKLASGISVNASRLRDIGVSTSYNGMGLAKNYILYAGFSRLEQDGTDRLIQRQGFLPQDPNSSYTYGTYGYSPMPGISSADIKTLTRGSLKKATVKLTAHNKQQFDIIDLLYLRLGYTVLLEWGNSIYTPDGVTREIVRNTLLENTFFNINGKGSYLDMLGPIEQYRQKYAGNYDALLGKVSNFSWAFQPDGSYDIELTIISLGDVIESLKTNISSPQNLTKFIEESTGGKENPDEPADQPDIIEDNKDANAIASMLWTWKWVNRTGISIDTESNPLYIKLGDGTESPVGGFLNVSGEDITADLLSYKFYYTAYEDGWIFDGSENPIRTNFPDLYPEYETTVKEFAKPDTRKQAEEHRKYLEEKLGNKKTFERSREVYSREGIKTIRYDTYKVKVRFKPVNNSERSVTTESPISKFEEDDAFWINAEPVQYYLRFGALLDYIENDILPKIDTDGKDKPPIFDIDTSAYSSFMYSLPNQISLDPRVCLVRNDHFTKDSGTAEVLSKLNPFRAEDYVQDNPNLNKAYPFNIYLNFEFIIESLNSNADERGDVNMYNFLKSICDGLNKALGGINNLEPIIDESSNTLKILDTTPIPGFGQRDADYILQLYGYKKAGSLYSSTFVRKVDLKTAITPEYATMITVGATAGGYVKGTEATAFSKWNIGLTDRFKEKFIPGNPSSQKKEGEIDEAIINYTEKFLSPNKFTSCYGFSGNLKESSPKLKISTDAIENNLSVVTEYFKYLISSQESKSGGTIGFIPFKISFTMDGISGIKIYNKLHVDTRFLPKAYGDNLNLIVTGVSHKLSNDDWETDIEATVIPKTDGGSNTIITAEVIKEDIQEATFYAPLGPVPPTNWEIDHESFARYRKGTERGKNIDEIIAAFKIAGITNPYAMVALLCTMGKESSFENKRENMNYSYSQLIDPERSPWGTYFSKNEARKALAFKLTKADGNYYGNKGGAETFANFIYGYEKSTPPGKRTKQNSAGNLTWGDGWKYRGGGYNGITFKAIYEDYGNRIGLDLVKFPEKISEPRVAAKVAVEYYKKTISIKKLNSVTSINAALDLCIRATAGRGADSVTISRNREKANKQLPGFKIVYK
jgi:putative chitinase